MYCNYFGFIERPFEVSPDPDFLYLSPGHREMLASLIYGIQERKGFIAVIGEVGTGKTTMLKALMVKLSQNIDYAYVFNSGGSFEEFLNQILLQFGLRHQNEQYTVARGVKRLQEYAFQRYQRGGNVVLIIDEAQNLDRELMENIRLLSNYEAGKHRLIQIVLAGQIELEEKLRRYDLRQLAQRINLRRYVIPLNRQDTFDYIQHRLTLSGYQGSELFSRAALWRIRRYSGGIPRKINVICDNSLLTAYGLNKKRVTLKIVNESISDLESNRLVKRFGIQGLRFSPLWCLLIAIGFFLVMWTGVATKSSETSAFSLTTQGKDLAHDAMISCGNGKQTQHLLSDAPCKTPSAHTTLNSLAALENSVDGKDNQAMKSRLLSNTTPTGMASNNGLTFVIAKPGDSLSKILRRYYGDFRVAWLTRVLEMNPAITDVNVIEIGQTIILPPFEEMTTNGLVTS